MIPRWRSPDKSVDILGPPPKPDLRAEAKAQAWLKRLIGIYERNPSEQTERELYETASLMPIDSSLRHDVGRIIDIKRHDELTERLSTRVGRDSICSIDQRPRDETDSNDFGASVKIRQLRTCIRATAQRPFVWSELARCHAILGDGDKAKRAMAIALHLAGKSRYLARAASRLYVHLNEADRAVHFLRNHAGVSEDPWLMSAEIATASVVGRRSPFVKRALKQIASQQFSPIEISELTASVGTLELENGASKRAKRLFDQSLKDPTENAVAQAQWASEQDSRIVVPDDAREMFNSFEAKAMFLRSQQQFKAVLVSCDDWLTDEPFSARPAIMGSYVAIFSGTLDRAIKFATVGLRANRDNLTLLNNRAVARAYRAEVAEAIQDVQFALTMRSSRDKPYFLATLGLIAFRSGHIQLGQELYYQSVRWFHKIKDQESLVSAALHWIREEVELGLLNLDEAEKLVRRIQKSGVISKNQELLKLADFVLLEAGGSAGSGIQKRKAVGLDISELMRCEALLKRPASVVTHQSASKAVVASVGELVG